MKKLSMIFEWISGILSLIFLGINTSLIIKFINLYTSNPVENASVELNKGIILVFLIIFFAIMDVVALPRWIIYTCRSVKKRGILKAFTIQFPFFVLFTALFICLYSLANENMELLGIIISSLLGGLGITFIFANVDLYIALKNKLFVNHRSIKT